MTTDTESSPIQVTPFPGIGAPSLSASSNRIDLWLLRYDRIDDEALLTRLRQWLNPAERAQEPRFYFADDRKRYLLTRALVRATLSRYVPVAPAQWRFGTNAYGRPHIEATQGQAGAELRFNLSHTYGLIALAVTREREIGIDVEHVSHREVSLDIAHHFLAPEEVAALAQMPVAQQQDRFFEYWTFKEAYIKARGMGLSLPLDHFSFDYPQCGTVRLSVRPELDDDAALWSLWQYRPQPHYLLALCAQRDTSAPTQVCVRELSTTLQERTVALLPTRRLHDN
ncbi:4'-phosphopantetheinyl transferase family protein [Xanthomonas arboricola]|uniref:4'-phosphopantetheinyl transferase family protein n=1 Tax=Xanthomonas arboricola TaxID=56448 RepID=UPI000C8391E1|nr:4'-phosphopantetheinyl transferase superfamily protein [Xanthomonas arboricola]SOU07167.1 HetI protein [Xanthomonas arboricola pv. fragariae]